MKKLVLIDGNAILHRAFHALPPLTDKNGQIVNAVYGFFSMFLKILQDQKPDFIIVCFDRKAPTFRKELYVGYQAKRPKMSDDLVPQIRFVHDILEKAKVEVFEVDGYEADDLIGTISSQAIARGPVTSFPPASAPSTASVRAVGSPSTGTTPRLQKSQELEVIIVSGDRDLLQLVNSHVRMIAPITGLTNMIVYDSAKVEEKYGIKPSQFIDYKALVGDPSDNYPGVAGIGPKTAVNLINEYGNLKEIYKNLERIKNKNLKLALKLAQDAESAGLAQKLAKIVTDAPIKLDIEKCAISNMSKEGLKKEFEKFGFKSLLKRLENGAKEPEVKNREEKKEGQQLGLL